MQATGSMLHGDPVAPVIQGVTTVLAFAVIVLTVFVTTLAAPPWLKIALSRQSEKRA